MTEEKQTSAPVAANVLPASIVTPANFTSLSALTPPLGLDTIR